jgi:hypothetical protein
MKEISRHFIMPRLGRGSVTARLTEDGGACVDILFSSMPVNQLPTTLYLEANKVKLIGLTGVDLLFQTSRIAISQVQATIARHETLASRHSELNIALTPWNGDLTEIPYGGATIGCTGMFGENPFPRDIYQCQRHNLAS